MSREQFYDVVIDSEGNAIPNATVSVYARGTANLQTIYPQEAGGSAKANPFVVTDGIVSFWAVPGKYDVHIHDNAVPAVVADRTVAWDAMPYDDVKGLTFVDDGSVDAGLIAADAVGASEIGANAVGTVEIADAAVTRAKLAQDAISPAIVTVLPTTGLFEGYEAILDTQVDSVHWLLRHSPGEATYKWRFIGGPPLTDSDTGGIANNQSAYGAIGAAPSIAVRAGVYVVAFGAKMATGRDGAANEALIAISPSGAGITASDANGIVRANGVNAYNDMATHQMREYIATLSAGTLTIHGKSGNGSAVAVHLSSVWLRVTPIKII